MGRREEERTVFEVFFGWEGELGCDELEATFLESGEDLADETTIDAVGLLGGLNLGRVRGREGHTYLDHDVGALVDVWGHRDGI